MANNDVIVRHNSLRNLVDSIGTDALQSGVVEKILATRLVAVLVM
jgi:hypothetical protein